MLLLLVSAGGRERDCGARHSIRALADSRVEMPQQEWRYEPAPGVLRLREPVGDRVESARQVCEAAVASHHLDVLGYRRGFLKTRLPVDDTIGFGVDRRCGD